MLGLSQKEINDRFDTIAGFADIGEFLDRPVKTYSSGMFARLAFATAIHVEPEILIVDEILAVGDSRFQRKCVKKFNEIRNNGSTILFVSHDDYQVRNICDRALYLDKGKQRYFGNADTAVQYYLSAMQEPVSNDKKEKKKSDDEENNRLIKIGDVLFTDSEGNNVNEINSGDKVSLSFIYHYEGERGELDGLVFVFNLYRKDGIYICGTTTAMRGLSAFPVLTQARVTIDFPHLKLLAGIYHWRVAVNDSNGIQIIDEALPVCEFIVKDNFNAVGIYDIEHSWSTEAK